MQTVLHLTPPAPFDFAGTAYSHGWVVLAPNAWIEDSRAMTPVDQLGGGNVVLLEIAGEGTARKPDIRVQVTHRGRLSGKDAGEIRARVARMFRLDEDLGDFYSMCRGRGGQWKKVTAGLGRLLRSPSVLEDVVKIICTTNIQWGGTKKMVAGLVEAYGKPYPGDSGRKAFPVPEAIASVHPGEFAGAVRMGYRAPYVHELAERVAARKLDLEALLDPELPTTELKKRLLAIKGIGPYAAATLLMLLGRYDTLAVDTVCRDFVKKKYLDGRTPADAEIHRIYEDWGDWRFLAYWFDIWLGFHEKL